jgi:maltooligosyltrehalose trehalohydrolase
MIEALARLLPIGAEPLASGVHFRVWAPRRRKVEVLFEKDGRPAGALELRAENGGYFSGLAPGARPGDLYRFRLDGGLPLPDPASRFQPLGPHGPSEVVDPNAFAWTDEAWRGLRLKGQVLYELHAGTFTPEGTWAAAARQLPALAELGITALELMPVAEFPGRFGWGYDGVDLFAPTRNYGRPEDLKAFVDRAHALGLGVVLDVVYNHLGPDGNYLGEYSRSYFSERYSTDWGDAINFDGPDSGPVREFFTANAAYWIGEHHFDGLRLDATQDIRDESRSHVILEIQRAARRAARAKPILLIAENQPQDSRITAPPADGGFGLDAAWNDDFHHSARVALTGRREAYYWDFKGAPQELVSAAKRGFLYQGQRYHWQSRRRGSPAFDVPPRRFVTYLENHDQVANTLRGLRPRLSASAPRHRALTALWLLSPQTPMFFQGQEFGSTAPFVFFADHKKDLSRLVVQGRREFLRQFPTLAGADLESLVAAPEDLASFRACKLDRAAGDARQLALHRDLLALRKRAGVCDASVDGAVLGPEAFVLRFFMPDRSDFLLAVNLGGDLELTPCPEPLLAPPPEGPWRPAWSSEDPRYGGEGAVNPVDRDGGWLLQGATASFLEVGPDA